MATVELDLALARRLIDHCVAQAGARFGKPICVAVCDAHGFLVGFARGDGAPVRSIALAQQKAYTAARIGSTTTAFLERLRREEIDVGYFCDPLLTPLPGGALILDRTGSTIGAVGVSGLKPGEDQAVADGGMEGVAGGMV